MRFPNRPVRRAQFISPFGIGAMVNFPGDECLMPTVIDEWPEATQPCPPDSGWKIRDERLEARLGVTHFRFPPDYREPDRDESFAHQRVPMVRFPRWHYCHLCGGMEYLSLHERRSARCQGHAMEGRSCAKTPENRRSKLMPVRFVAVCEKGHIEDFPFMEWAHSNAEGLGPITNSCRLRLRAGVSSANLAGVIVECVTCKKQRSLSNAFQFSAKGGPLAKLGLQCRGGAPWAGVNLPASHQEHQERASCGQQLRVVQRGGSNVYFSSVVSSIYLQGWAEQEDPLIIELLDDPDLWEGLCSGTVDAAIPLTICQAMIKFRKLGGKLTSETLQAAANKKLKTGQLGNTPQVSGSETEYREAEYKALCDGRGDMRTDFYVLTRELKKYDSSVAGHFERIHLVPKLRETRVLRGFSRLNPTEGGPNMRDVRNNRALDWLPATVAYGEGIFLELSSQKLEQWEERYRRSRPQFQHMFDRLNARRANQGLPKRPLFPAYLLVHALAHALINQLSFDCGYGSASLRERLYFQRAPGRPAMHGLLIYTASGDSEGSMGGLVRQGEAGRFEATLRRAIDRATWCSNDPVCLESSGQGSESCNLAACHSCLLLPETSCEEGNRLLDRAVLVGTHGQPDFGYFSSLI